MAVSPERVNPCNDAPVRPDGSYVLYWMIAARRTRWSFALEHAVSRSLELGLPLLVLEALRVGYPWASRRLHGFAMAGMLDNAAALDDAGVGHHLYVEPEHGHGAGLLAALSRRAAVVVTDEYPCFFLPRMVEAAATRIGTRLEQVDGNGLLPLRSVPRAFPTAVGLRRHLQRTARTHLLEQPLADPLHPVRGMPRAVVPAEVLTRWPAADLDAIRDGSLLARLPVDPSVGPVALRGGARAGRATLERFLERLDGYADDRNHPDRDGPSGLSPYLHFGQVSAHQVLSALFEREGWRVDHLATDARGRREGWWRVSRSAEAFLDQLITWRELGFAACFHDPHGYGDYASVPDWARSTLEDHAADRREHLYPADQLAAAQTHDPVWNAAQTQLLREGRIHNYLRMVWGKRVLEWTSHPAEAWEVLVDLNNRYALDGRDPNSWSGIAWVFGRYDRAWGPERPIFGKVRYMSSRNTVRKLRMRAYLERFAG